MKLNKNLHHLNYVLGEINALYHQMATYFHLSDSSMQILYVLCDNEGSCPLTDLYKQTGISKQTISSSLRKLEQEGILYLEQHNKKSKDVFLTEQGKELSKKTISILFELENKVFESWSKEDQNQHIALNEQYAHDFKVQIDHLLSDSSERNKM